MRLLAGEDYSRYFELPPSMQGLELPRGQDAIKEELQASVLQKLKELATIPPEFSPCPPATCRELIVSTRRCISILERSSFDQSDKKASRASHLKCRTTAMTMELVSIKFLSELNETLFEYRKRYPNLSKNSKCLCNLDELTVMDFEETESTEGAAFNISHARELLNFNELPEKEVEQFLLFTQHPNKDISETVNFCILRRTQASLVYRIALIHGSLFRFLMSNNPLLSQSKDLVHETAKKMSPPALNILLAHYRASLSLLESMESGTLKISHKLTSPSNEDLEDRNQNIEEWKKSLPEAIKEYEAVWRELEGIKKTVKNKQKFREDYMSPDSQTFFQLPEEFGFQDAYGPVKYQAMALSLLSKTPMEKESISSPIARANKAEKTKRNRGKKKGSAKANKKRVREPKPPQSDSCDGFSLEKTNKVQETSAKKLPQPEILKEVLPFARLTGPKREEYSERVLSWIEEETPYHLTTESYSYLSLEKKLEQHRRHGFSLEVDKFIEDKDYAKITTWENSKTGHQDRSVFIAGEMEHLGKKQRGFFIICYGHDDKIYHRHFTTVSTRELMEASKQSTYKYDFPSLREAAEALNDTPCPPSLIERKKDLSKAAPGAFGSVTIFDEFHNAKITLFKRSEQ